MNHFSARCIHTLYVYKIPFSVMIWRSFPRGRQTFSLPQNFHTDSGATHPHIQWYWGSFSGSKSGWSLKLITAPCSVEAKNGPSEYSPTCLEVLGIGKFTFLILPYYFNGTHPFMYGSIEVKREVFNSNIPCFAVTN